jgi:hypothetical protein
MIMGISIKGFLSIVYGYLNNKTLSINFEKI